MKTHAGKQRALLGLLLAVASLDLAGRWLGQGVMNSIDFASTDNDAKCVQDIIDAYRANKSASCRFGITETKRVGKETESNQFVYNVSVQWADKESTKLSTKLSDAGKPAEVTKTKVLRLRLTPESQDGVSESILDQQASRDIPLTDANKDKYDDANEIHRLMRGMVTEVHKAAKKKLEEQEKAEKAAAQREKDYENCIRNEDGRAFANASEKLACYSGRLSAANPQQARQMAQRMAPDLRRMIADPAQREEAMGILESARTSGAPADVRRSFEVMAISARYMPRIEEARRNVLMSVGHPGAMEMSMRMANGIQAEYSREMAPFVAEAQRSMFSGGLTTGGPLMDELRYWDMHFAQENVRGQQMLMNALNPRSRSAGGLNGQLGLDVDGQLDFAMNLRGRTARGLRGDEFLSSQRTFDTLLGSRYYNSMIAPHFDRGAQPFDPRMSDPRFAQNGFQPGMRPGMQPGVQPGVRNGRQITPGGRQPIPQGPGLRGQPGLQPGMTPPPPPWQQGSLGVQ